MGVFCTTENIKIAQRGIFLEIVRKSSRKGAFRTTAYIQGVQKIHVQRLTTAFLHQNKLI